MSSAGSSLRATRPSATAYFNLDTTPYLVSLPRLVTMKRKNGATIKVLVFCARGSLETAEAYLPTWLASSTRWTRTNENMLHDSKAIIIHPDDIVSIGVGFDGFCDAERSAIDIVLGNSDSAEALRG